MVPRNSSSKRFPGVGKVVVPALPPVARGAWVGGCHVSPNTVLMRRISTFVKRRGFKPNKQKHSYTCTAVVTLFEHGTLLKTTTTLTHVVIVAVCFSEMWRCICRGRSDETTFFGYFTLRRRLSLEYEKI